MKLKINRWSTVLFVMSVLNFCMDIIKEENKSSLIKHQDGLPSPKEICSVPNDYVIGQKLAKKFYQLLFTTIIKD